MPTGFAQRIEHFWPDMFMVFPVFCEAILANFELEANAFHCLSSCIISNSDHLNFNCDQYCGCYWVAAVGPATRSSPPNGGLETFLARNSIRRCAHTYTMRFVHFPNPSTSTTTSSPGFSQFFSVMPITTPSG